MIASNVLLLQNKGKVVALSLVGNENRCWRKLLFMKKQERELYP